GLAGLIDRVSVPHHPATGFLDSSDIRDTWANWPRNGGGTCRLENAAPACRFLSTTRRKWRSELGRGKVGSSRGVCLPRTQVRPPRCAAPPTSLLPSGGLDLADAADQRARTGAEIRCAPMRIGRSPRPLGSQSMPLSYRMPQVCNFLNAPTAFFGNFS